MWKTTDEFYSLFQCCGRKTVTGKPHCLWLIVFDVVVFLSHSMSYISQIIHRFQVFPWKTISWSFDTNLPDSGPDIGTDCHLPLLYYWCPVPPAALIHEGSCSWWPFTQQLCSEESVQLLSQQSWGSRQRGRNWCPWCAHCSIYYTCHLSHKALIWTSFLLYVDEIIITPLEQIVIVCII